ncbi:type II secretion system protein J [Pseudomonas alcaligenes]|uniref:Type II secretion system protein n=1 Tax=Aquipseudomonas alcaligenes TaxID=43263 RepID=A0A2V4L2D8_AQUAC|nr:type II secretion system protein [Pseudomonas alcaligenes]PYC23632.1 type II secretion system protein [Pseudomonas alcaligenes]
MRRGRGFTLVELVMVIALAGLVGLMISTVLSRPMEGFIGQSRRAELVDSAAGALQRMSRDVRLAVPNSLRVSADGQAVELLLIHSAARYRPNRVGEQGLRFSTDAAGTCSSTTQGGRCDSLQVLDDGFDPAGARWLVLYNIGAESGGSPLPGSNVWAPANPGVITPTGTSFTPLVGAPAGESHIALGNLPAGGFRFAFASPQHRLYLAETVVGYRCQGDQLLRYSYNQLLNALPASPPPGSNPQPVARQVASCNFAYQSGSTQRAGLLSLSLGIAEAGENLQLLQQVHVDNAP